MQNSHFGVIMISASIVIGSLLISKNIDKLNKNIYLSQEKVSRSINNFRPIEINRSNIPEAKVKKQNDTYNSELVFKEESPAVLSVWADDKEYTFRGFEFLVTFDKSSHLLIVDYYLLNENEKHEVIYIYKPRKWEFGS